MKISRTNLKNLGSLICVRILPNWSEVLPCVLYGKGKYDYNKKK
jgi:hypothetical protein